MHRSAAAVCWALATFIALQLGFHYPLSQWWPQLHDVEFGKKEYLLRAQLRDRTREQPLVLALGSSLTGMGLRPGEMASTQSSQADRPLVFNYAIKGGPILVQLVCLQRLLAEGIHPDLVIVETYPPFFLAGADTDPGKLLEHFPSHRFYRQDLALVTRYSADGHRVRQEWREGQCVPWYFHRNYLVNWYLPRWVPNAKRINFHLWQTDEWGWDSCAIFYEQARVEYGSPQHLDGLRKQGENWSQRKLDEKLNGALRDLLALCKAEKIDVMMVWPPEASLVRDTYSPALNERVERWLGQLEADTGTPVVHARAWVDDAKFAEGLHLMPDGAIDYTHKLELELLKRLDANRRRTARR